MGIQFRNYINETGITEDYFKVRSFLVKLGSTNYTYARWDWMITHSHLDQYALGKIGLWEDSNQIIGVALYDVKIGYAYCLALPDYEYMKKEMLLYAKENLSKDTEFAVVIPDTDINFQDIATNLGFMPTTHKECDAIFYIEKTGTDYSLPEGFRLTTMKETYSPFQYRRVLWKGFNHEINGEGEFAFSEEQEKEVKCEMLRPNVDLNLKIAVVAPDGNFVSYCGMWYDDQTDFAIIEPVATDPDYRKMGLGKAAVLEGIRRVGELGAKRVLVGSSQQFYYSIGMRPFSSATEWKSK
ncbi:GNAT family N-acetyltransferase [Haloplasma contractile]|uniref:N-acetyltransferase domain-containing protein n=1 Tax=Haloplasma contractile SSD-17B TaxID=1033810 RepID=U2E726_9MOLU|nr:GNAT family N-acetyltransferase [Haloplasma contractile]ERJ11003.1 Acetyltransferase putative protein [Haloplasma contractile SSD-17B]